MKEELEHDRWASFLDEVSRTQHGDAVSIEILSEALGDQSEALGLSLSSVGYDRGDDAIIVELATADDQTHIVLRRIISSPSSLSATPPRAGQVTAIRIENDDGVTLVGIRPREELTY